MKSAAILNHHNRSKVENKEREREVMIVIFLSLGVLRAQDVQQLVKVTGQARFTPLRQQSQGSPYARGRNALHYTHWNVMRRDALDRITFV